MRWHYRLSLGRLAGAAPAAVAALLAASSPGPASATTLREALAATYRSNPRLEIARAQLRATDELVAQALSGYRPRMFLDGGVEAARGEIGRTQTSLGGLEIPGLSDASPRDGSQTTRRTTRQVGLSVQQNLYAGGGTAAQVRQAQNQVAAERAALAGTEQQVLLDAVTAYADVWRDKSVLSLALNNEQRLERQLQATRDRFRYGEAPRTDLAQARARLSQARADVEAAKAGLAASRARYRQVVGEEPGVLRDPEPAAPLPPSLEQALAVAGGNPDIANATFALSAARDAVRAAYANLLPSVDLTSDLSYANQLTFQQPWQRQAAIGVQVTVPLYQGGAEYSQVRQRRQQVDQGRSGLEAAQRAVRESVAATWDQLFAARAAISSLRDQVRANRIALDGVQQEQQVGLRTVLDVLDAEQELFSSQVNLARARRDFAVTSYQLKAAVGELTADDLKLGVTPYDPKVHYARARSRLFGLDGGR